MSKPSEPLDNSGPVGVSGSSVEVPSGADAGVEAWGQRAMPQGLKGVEISLEIRHIFFTKLVAISYFIELWSLRFRRAGQGFPESFHHRNPAH